MAANPGIGFDVPVIVNAAISGSIPINASEFVPRSAEDVGRQALQAWRAGAAVVHLHTRDANGTPSGQLENFRRAVDIVRDADSDVIINLTTSFTGSAEDDHAVRLSPLTLSPELASFDAGSMNFNDRLFRNTAEFLRKLATAMNEHNVKPEIEIFDIGMISNAVRLADEGLLPSRPLYFQFVLGVRGGAPATAKQLLHMVESLPEGAIWSVCGIGRHQLPMDALGILLGGHVRTGLEDNLFFERGVPASNPQLVERVVALAGTLGRKVATPTEAREILGLPPR